METYKEIMEKSYNELPEKFNSRDFTSRMHLYGVHKSYTNSGVSCNFLKKKGCKQVSKYTWIKSDKSIQEDKIYTKIGSYNFSEKQGNLDFLIEKNITYIIKHIKSLGYKVFKTELIEL